MELGFDAILCSNVGNAKSDAGHINAHAGRRITTPDLQYECFFRFWRKQCKTFFDMQRWGI